MNYYLLWLAHLAWGILFVCLIVALASRCKKARWRKFWPILTTILIFLTFAAAAVGGGIFLVINLQPKWLFWYGLTHTLAYLIGIIIILKRGLKGLASEHQVGRVWPRGLLVVAFVLALFIYLVILNFIDMRIMVKVTNLRAETTSKIIELMPPLLPNALNAHPVYERAAKALGPRDEMPKWLKKSIRPDFNPTSKEVTSLLNKNKAVLATVRRAASMPGYALEVDVTNMIQWPIPQYSPYRNIAKLLSLSARSKALAGDLAGALEELAVIEGMAEHLRGFPILISFMIAISLEETRVQGLEYVLASTTDHPKGLIKLPVIGHPSVLKDFVKSLYLETEIGLQTLTIYASSPEFFGSKHVQKFERRLIDFSTILGQLWRVFLLPSDLKVARDVITYRIRKPAETYQEVHENLKAIEGAKESGEFGLFMLIAHPTWTGYMVRAMKYEALRGLSDLAFAATAYKAANGQYPTTLENLVPGYIDQIPTDPFDGQSLKVKPMDGGLDLYSVGPSTELASGKIKGPIHFYLGRVAYQEHRIKAAREDKK